MLGAVFLFDWADLKAFLHQEASGFVFLCLLAQVMAILTEPLANRKLRGTLSSTRWGFTRAPAALSALPETRAREGASVKVPPSTTTKAEGKGEPP